MNPERTAELIEKINQIEIVEEDITTEADRSEGRMRVRVKYVFGSTSFESKDLFYQRVTGNSHVRNPKSIEDHFGTSVYWLDLEKHDWPQGSKESDLEKLVIPDICGDDSDFRDFLLKVANNAQTGLIQEMTRDGQRGQYYHNLVNNNHWHDLIFLIKAYIKSGGEPIEERYFSPLVFEWRDGKRTSLSSTFGSRKIIEELQKNIREVFKAKPGMAKTEEVVKLLRHKPQVILQGPPGTGKTRLALEVGHELCKSNEAIDIDNQFINENLHLGLELATIREGNKFSIVEIGEGVRIKLKNGGEYSVSRDRIITCLGNNDLNKSLSVEYNQNVGPYILGIAKYLSDRFNERFIKLIQFHPSYSYEDFVRGITAKVTEGQIKYEAMNKVLGDFAQEAQQNFINSRKDINTYSREKWVEDMLGQYADLVQEKLAESGKYPIGNTIVYIFDVEEDAFRYKGDNWRIHEGGLRMKFKQLIELYLHGVSTRQDIKKLSGSKGLVNGHATYYNKILQDFREFLKDKPLYNQHRATVVERKYVMIIDEINRANLSSVLGELIYALEYRGKPVQSLYEVEGDRELILPPNLYIIGTMNTADRSVGHIDYAIRRRFSFYQVLPDEKVVVANGSAKAYNLFKKMTKLFRTEGETSTTYLSPEFNWEDVMIGHSYFLEDNDEKLNDRIKYELKPILREYIKDGILAEAAWSEIERW